MSLGLGLSFGGMLPWDGEEEAPVPMASSFREAGINRAAALGSALPQRSFRVAMVLSPLRRAWGVHKRAGC